MLTQTPDNSLIDETGKVIYFSADRFIDTIAQGDCCFMCGVSPNDAEFNGEHIIPKWVLKKFDLFAQSVTLPNETLLRYDQYVTPCCKSCNSHLGGTIERSVAEIVNKGHRAVAEYVLEKGPWLFFVWLNLLFLKTHLKDNSLRLHRNLLKPDDKIAAAYAWNKLHHIHCIARSGYTETILDPTALGSLFILPAQPTTFDRFDYHDLYGPQTIMIRLDDTVFVCVLNDSCAAWNVLAPHVAKITAPLSPIQIRELMAIAAYINVRLKYPPVFESKFSGNTQTISAHVAQIPELNEGTPSEYGALHYAASKSVLEASNNPDMETIINHIKTGGYSFLFDAAGNFCPHSEAKG